MNNTRELFLIENHYRILKSVGNGLKKKYGLAVAKDSGVTYSHTIKLLKEMQDLGLVEKGDKDGRIKQLSLTQNGRIVLLNLQEIKELLN